jgi:Na(+) dependent transporter,sodium bile acid symporter family protein
MTQELSATIDNISVNLNQAGMNTINIVLAFVMFGVALGIRPSMFVDVLRKPKSVILGICCQMILLPAFTFILAVLMKDWISPMMGLGMILVASCPGGNISNFMSSLSKANTELSVTLTAFSTAAAMFTTPANFALWGGWYLRFATKISTDLPELHIEFWEVFKTVVILLGIPLVLGILCSHYLPKIAEKLKKPLQYISILFFIVMVVMAFSQNIDAFMKCIRYIFVVVLLHNLLALLIGFGVGTAFRTPEADRRTLTIETGIQNSGLGLVLLLGTGIFAGFPPHGGMLVITAWWGIWHIVSGLTVAFIFNRSRKA